MNSLSEWILTICPCLSGFVNSATRAANPVISPAIRLAQLLTKIDRHMQIIDLHMQHNNVHLERMNMKLNDIIEEFTNKYLVILPAIVA